MTVVWVVAGAVALLLAAGFAWGYVRLQRNSLALAEALKALEIEEIAGLAVACADTFAQRLGSDLDVDDPRESARILDRAVREVGCAAAFARTDLEWAYVLHCGAFLGELLRRHAGGRWEAQDDGSPGIVIGQGDATIRTWPFEKILKHRMQGDPGDLVAYVQACMRGPELIEVARTGTEG